MKLDGHDLFLDPGTPFNPFGQLPWPETAVSGLRLDKDGGTWLNTPVPAATDSSIDRSADLRLTTTGSLEGQITVTYTGLEALARRVRERNEDDVARRRFLEAQVRSYIANRSEVSLANTPDWDSADTKLVAVFHVKVPGWASISGQRAFSAIGLFGAHEKRAFLHGFRVHPVYFAYPFEMADDITIALPAGSCLSRVSARVWVRAPRWLQRRPHGCTPRSMRHCPSTTRKPRRCCFTPKPS